MISLALSFLLCLFVVAVFFNTRLILSPITRHKGIIRIVLLFWIMMLIGMSLWVPHDARGGLSYLSGSYALQIGVTLLIALFVTILASQIKPTNVELSTGLRFMFLYGLIGMLTAVTSPAFELTLWKGGVIIIDSLFVLVSIKLLIKLDNPKAILNLVYAVLMGFIALNTLGAILWPSESLIPIGGIIGVHLYGVMPHLNPNELGFISAITSLVYFRRMFEQTSFKLKLLLFSCFSLSATVLLLSQARTSIVAFILGIIALSIGLRHLRWVSAVGIVAFISFFFVYLMTGTSSGIEDILMSYMSRGLSDKQLSTMSGRTELWTIGWKMFMDSPFFGHGFETGVSHKGMSYGLKQGIHMHNAHMQVLVNTGIFGYLLWFSMLSVTSWKLFSTREFIRTNKQPHKDNIHFHYETLAVLGIMLLRTTTGSVLVFHQYSFTIIMGMMVYLALIKHQSRRSNIKRA